MTTPWKTWMRERVPSMMLTCTLTVSPGRKSGMSDLRLAASTWSRMCMMVRSLRPPPVERGSLMEVSGAACAIARAVRTPRRQSPAAAQSSIVPCRGPARQSGATDAPVPAPAASVAHLAHDDDLAVVVAEGRTPNGHLALCVGRQPANRACWAASRSNSSIVACMRRAPSETSCQIADPECGDREQDRGNAEERRRRARRSRCR